MEELEYQSHIYDYPLLLEVEFEEGELMTWDNPGYGDSVEILGAWFLKPEGRGCGKWINTWEEIPWEWVEWIEREEQDNLLQFFYDW